MPDTHYPFRRRQEPARAIHDAFQLEANKRKGRQVDEWIKAELQAVFVAAHLAADCQGLRKLTMEEIQSAERYARGSVDYGSTWPYTVVDGMRRPAARRHA
ncbi:hypothetical protein [Polaromonas sp. JS666]|uniref:hypothetical protein n=1 Tax=Polaromonas sp. (strain JS666 / ATCC BAA-500) TaxID=296591 RepID=UPI0000464727|nr:hypothetical protein [Polaromonas sp. JS666]ABE47370.1 hypothetical protein Bpro_5517 [Polaromonas sp. JS666]